MLDVYTKWQKAHVKATVNSNMHHHMGQEEANAVYHNNPCEKNCKCFVCLTLSHCLSSM